MTDKEKKPKRLRCGDCGLSITEDEDFFNGGLCNDCKTRRDKDRKEFGQ